MKKKERGIKLVRYLVVWLILWILSWVGFLYIRDFGIGYVNGFWISALYFFIASAIIIFFFKKDFHPLVKNFEYLPIFILLCSIILSFLIYDTTNIYFQKPIDVIGNYDFTEFIGLESSYLVPKLMNILFQQTLMVLLVSFFIKLKIPTKEMIVSIVLVFSIAHAWLFVTEGFFPGVFYFTASIAAAITFPLLIRKVNYGFVYSYTIHYLFYVLSGFILRIAFMSVKI